MWETEAEALVEALLSTAALLDLISILFKLLEAPGRSD